MGSHPACEGYKYRGPVLRDGGWAWGYKPYRVKKKMLRSLPEIQSDFVEEAKALAGLWGQGK
jgi:hypothetical protein